MNQRFHGQRAWMTSAWSAWWWASWLRPSEPRLCVAPGQEFIPVEHSDPGGELDRPRHVGALVEPAADGADFDAQELGGLLGAQGLFLRSRLHDMAFVALQMQV